MTDLLGTRLDQDQFLDVIDRDEAERRFHAAIRLQPLGEERVPLADALGRVLARDVVAPVDVPSFDRSNYDGFAVRAADTYGSREEQPRESATAGRSDLPRAWCPPAESGRARPCRSPPAACCPAAPTPWSWCEEHADVDAGGCWFAGRSRRVSALPSPARTSPPAKRCLRRGTCLTSRETGVLAAIGVDRSRCGGGPRGDPLDRRRDPRRPGQPMRPGLVYDSNARILADAVRELGGEPVDAGDRARRPASTSRRLCTGPEPSDLVLLSGGTSKGAGDLSYRVVGELAEPGIVAHGVALKPGKPICLAACAAKPVVVLPGFPTSAIFTFHEFVAPVIRRLAGRPAEQPPDRSAARMAVKVNSEIGRTEYLLVGWSTAMKRPSTDDVRLTAYPMGKGSGSVTTFSRADGFVDHRPPAGDCRGGSRGDRPVARPRAAGGRPGGDRQPLRGAGLSAGPAAGPRLSHQVSGRGVHRRAGGGTARRMRRGRDAPAGRANAASTIART